MLERVQILIPIPDALTSKKAVPLQILEGVATM